MSYSNFPTDKISAQHSGLSSFEFVPAGWLKSVPEGGLIKEEDIELKPGKSWLLGYGFTQTKQFNEASKSTSAGPLYSPEIEGFIPFWTEGLNRFFRFNSGKRFVIKIRDYTNQIRLAGHDNKGLLLEVQHNIGSRTSASSGYRFTYKGQSREPARFVRATDGSTPIYTQMVNSVHGRQGNVVGEAGDYDAPKIEYNPGDAGDWSPPPAKVSDALDQLAANISGSGVTTFNGRAGAVIPVAGDYDASQIDETATEKIMTDVERDKLTNIAVTQAVDLDAIEQLVNNLDAAIVLKGSWDASSGTFPGGGTAQAGYSYIVDTSGTVDGVDFQVDDRIIAILDNASTATYAANWHKADYSDLVNSVTVGDALAAAGAKTTPVDADTIPLNDSAASNALKKLTIANLKATLKTYFDTLYPAISHTHTSDEITGTVLDIPGATLTLDATHDNKILLCSNSTGCVVTLFAASAGFSVTLINKATVGMITIETNATQILDSAANGDNADFVTDSKNQGVSLACLATNDFWAQ